MLLEQSVLLQPLFLGLFLLCYLLFFVLSLIVVFVPGRISSTIIRVAVLQVIKRRAAMRAQFSVWVQGFGVRGLAFKGLEVGFSVGFHVLE